MAMNNLRISNLEISHPVIALDDTVTVSFTLKNVSGSRVRGVKTLLQLRDPTGVAPQYSTFPIDGTGTAYGYYGDRDGVAVNLANNASQSFSYTFAASPALINAYNDSRTQYAARAFPVELAFSCKTSGGTYFGDSTPLGHLVDAHYGLGIEIFALERGTNGTPDDEGLQLLSTVRLSALPAADLSALSLSLEIRNLLSGEVVVRDLTAQIPALLETGVTGDAGLLAGSTFDNGAGFRFTLAFTDGIEPAVGVFDVPRAFANVHLSGAGTGGVAFGKFSSATEGNPLFECVYPAVFSGNVTVPVEGLLKAVPVTVASAQSVPASTVSNFTSAVDAGDGWTPIGIVGYNYNSRYMTLLRSYLNDDNEAACTIYNTDSSARSVTIVMYVLCLRTG